MNLFLLAALLDVKCRMPRKALVGSIIKYVVEFRSKP